MRINWIYKFLLIWTWCFKILTSISSYYSICFNRIGDVLLITIISYSFNSFYFNNELISYTNYNIIVLLLIWALSFKSILLTSYLWLPEAMEGPTPVSSLLHSCTLVVAGIYALYSISIIHYYFNVIFIIYTILIISSNINKLENELKRLIAISTIIAINYLWVLCISGLTTSMFIICVIHASYKATFFN